MPYAEPFRFIDGIDEISDEKISGYYTFKEDSEFYLDSVNESLIVGELGASITQAFDYYDKDMSKDMVASELNITSEQFDRYFEQLPLDLRAVLQPLSTGSLDRVTFEEVFEDLLEEYFDLTQQLN